MNQPSENNLSSRRDFLKTTGKVAAVSALAGVTLPHVHAAGSDQIQIALIGCGGRGTGAAGNAMQQSGPPKLVAMADVFEHRLNGSYDTLIKKYKDQIDVPQDRKFIGFDGYKNAMDCLKPGDIAIFTTPLAFRWVHFTYAIQKKLNVFMEKPLTADGPTSRKMLKLSAEASAKNLKVGVGLMSRHSRALQELHKRVQDGEIGDITLMRGYRMQGPIGSAFTTTAMRKEKSDLSDLMFQISRFHSFLWLSGGAFNDFYIHHVDHLCWMKNGWPVKAQALGGRTYKNAIEKDGQGNEILTPYIDQNLDSYSVEYTFEDGTKFLMDGRGMLGAHTIYSSYLHGTKGMAIASKNGDCGLPSSTYRNHNPSRDSQIWTSNVAEAEKDPYNNEWYDLLEAIRSDKPYNEVPNGVNASVTCNMGRYAAHTAQEVTFDEMLNHEHDMSPNSDKLTSTSEPPVKPDAKGIYPQPMPGLKKNREY
jgi:predicted dehydrogenase